MTTRTSIPELERGNLLRLQAAEINREVKEGILPIEVALFSREAGSSTVYRLLKSQYRWGRNKCMTALNRSCISEGSKVKNLTGDQLERLIEEVHVIKRRRQK